MNRKIREKYKIILDIAKCIKKKRIQLCWRMYCEKHTTVAIALFVLLLVSHKIAKIIHHGKKQLRTSFPSALQYISIYEMSRKSRSDRESSHAGDRITNLTFAVQGAWENSAM